MRVSTASSFLRAIRDIQTQQVEIGNLQAQIGSGRKLIRPSDGPTESARAVDLNQALSRLEQFSRNRDFADQQLGLVEATLSSVNNVLQRVRELTIQANSSAQTDETRAIIRTEIEQRLNEILDLANTRDGNGDYLFSGSRGNTQAFSIGPTGTVYNGDQSPRNLQISADRTIDISDSGFEVFQSIRNGNGTFLADINPANTGSGVISPGSVVDISAYQADDFRIVFTSPTTYDVINDSTATTILAGQTYIDGGNINFNGVQVEISGELQTGDEFNVQASRNQDIFQTLTNLINTLNISPFDTADEARLQQGLQRALGDIDQAIGNVLEIRTTVGTRQNSIDSVSQESDSASLVLQQSLSEVQDLDLAEAISQLSFQTTTLEAIQATFSRVQQLNLFNFLR